MNEATTRYVDAMYGGMEGYVYGAVSGGRGDWKQFYFHFPEQREELLKWVDAWAPHKNVFLAPSLFSEKKSTKDYWKCSNYVWVEFDGNYDPAQFKGIPAPHIIIQSSKPRHMHCYWKVHSGATREQVENLNRRLSRYLGADYSGFDCNQVLRPPGTHNHKEGKDLPVVEILNPDIQIPYPLEWFEMVPDVPTLQVVPNLENDLLPVEYVYKQHPDIRRAVERILDRVMKDADADRSDGLMQLAHTCAEQGLEPAMIMSAIVHMDLTLHKFVGRSDMWIRYQECVERALIKHPTGILTGFTIVDKQEVGDEEDPFEFMGSSTIAALDIKIEWLWENVLSANGLLILSGAPGTGKSQFTLDVLNRMALGEGHLGFDMTRAVTVGFVSLEMDLVEIHAVISRQHSAYSTAQKRTLDERVKISPVGEPLDLTNPKNQAALIKTIQQNKLDGIVIDALSSTTLESLSDETTAKAVLGWLAHLRQSLGIFIWIIHHNRKATSGNERPNKLADVHGAVYIAGVANTVLILWKNDKGETELIPVKSRSSPLDNGEHIFKLTRTNKLTFDFEQVTPAKGIEVKQIGKTMPL